MGADSEKEEQQIRNRLRDLAEKSFHQNMFTFTGFLGLSEQDVFWRTEPELRYAGYELYGGIGSADRQMIRFGNVAELGYEVPFPIVCIHVKPVIAKFADKLSHRDFLGALMNLGIERSVVGDIKVGDKEAWIFCTDTIAGHICENLEQVKHTHVTCRITEDVGQMPEEEPEKVSVQAASLRIDAVVAKLYNKSRGDCLELFRSGKVFVNGRLCENNSRLLKSGETVNVRGFGKFVMDGEPRETRKGKLNVELKVYR